LKLEEGQETSSKEAENGSDEDKGNNEPPKKKKKKKKGHSKEALQQKKLEKMKEVEAQLNDPEMPKFSGIGLSDNMNFIPESEVKPSEEETSSLN